jgi:hypothetical protein
MKFLFKYEKNPGWKRNVIDLFIGGIFFLFLFFYFGERAEQIFFSPESMQILKIQYSFLPYTPLPNSFQRKRLYHPKIVQYWITKGYINPGDNSQIWDLCHEYVPQWGKEYSVGRSGPARNFCGNLGEFDEYWIQWSKDHPEFAKKLWPKIMIMVEKAKEPQGKKYYLAASVLMDFIRSIRDPETFEDVYQEWKTSWEKIIPEWKEMEK